MDRAPLTSPCRSGNSYESCCQVIHNDLRQARLPLHVMRARHTAYVLNNKNFILSSWAHESRPQVEELQFPRTWIALEITDSDTISKDSRIATVRFNASFTTRNGVTTVSECSRFIKRSQCWYYLDGISESHHRKIGGNNTCPCGSTKKFKRCCQPAP